MNRNMKFVKILLLLSFFSFFGGDSLVFSQSPVPTPSLTVTPTPVATATVSPAPISPSPTPSNTSNQPVSDEKLKSLQDQIKEYQQKLAELQSQGKTLSSQIKIMDSQIVLTELRLSEAKRKIENLEYDIGITKQKIGGLEKEINSSTKTLLERINAVYEVGRMQPWQLFLTSDNISNFLTRLKYLKIVQIYDKKNIYAAEQAKVNYSNQKGILEEKQQEAEKLQEELEVYTQQLENEKKAKEQLLTITKNDEKKYQELLARARAEFEAIQNIIAGKGDEIEIGKIGEGTKVATVIEGSSCNSSGAHLHFIVSSGGSTQNPFNYLSGIDYKNCSGSGSSCDSGDGDPFNPQGGWIWPIDPTIRFSQGYGSTWAIQHTWVGQIYKFHNGIDIASSSNSDVKAVKSGILYRGSYSGSGGCKLRYVKIKHDDGGLETFYLHVNYN